MRLDPTIAADPIACSRLCAIKWHKLFLYGSNLTQMEILIRRRASYSINIHDGHVAAFKLLLEISNSPVNVVNIIHFILKREIN